MNTQNRKRLRDAENRLMVGKGEGAEGLSEKVKGLRNIDG